MTADPDPIDLLVEIAALTMEEMRVRGGNPNMTDHEAYMLGRIMGICSRHPEVMGRLVALEEQKQELEEQADIYDAMTAKLKAKGK